jgi:hypothetical protein
MSDASMAMSEAIRRAAGIGVEPPTEEQKPEPPGDPDFGAGAGQRGVQPESDMSAMIRAAAFGHVVRGGGER